MTAGSVPSVHVLVIHGVGRQDPLSNLLRTYQTIRANLTSVEVPIEFEDLIPGWRLKRFDEGATPATLILEPRFPQPGVIDSVHLYEVNYADLASVVRSNQPIDLTRLFIGLDLAVCAARQRPRTDARTVFGGDTKVLAKYLQRLTGVLIASTVPIIGLPSIIFRQYLGTFVATFTRFFEDIATFALDKNGEQLISAHLDRTIAAIEKRMKTDDRLELVAHSLGSVVAHNYVVRSWGETAGRTPDTFVTYGSPIGLLAWMWLFLDFEDMDFRRPISKGDNYFCWNPVGKADEKRTPLTWINVVNCVDPIATAFPDGAADLGAPPEKIREALTGGRIEQRYFGEDKISQVGAAHNEYRNNRKGFLGILTRAMGLRDGDPKEVQGRTAEEHWSKSRDVLSKLQKRLFGGGVLAILGYCALVASRFGDWRVMAFAAPLLWPAFAVGVLSMFQRLMLGGPNKRIPREQIRRLKWRDWAAWAYWLRERILTIVGLSRDVDPLKRSPGYFVRLLVKGLSFIPVLFLMAIPVAGGIGLTNHRPTLRMLWDQVFAWHGFLALIVFMVYVVCFAGLELVRTWRAVIAELRAHPPAV